MTGGDPQDRAPTGVCHPGLGIGALELGEGKIAREMDQDLVARNGLGENSQ
jgi:hypothetical protein